MERLHNLLGVVEAFGGRVPDLTYQFPRGTVALSVRGCLLL